jgi:inhibitor of cysteine peptidase
VKKKVIIGLVVVCVAVAVLLPTLLKANAAKRAPVDFSTVVNGTIEIKLDENPTTGYSWHVTFANPEILNIVKDDYSQTGDSLGSGGVHQWEMKGTKAGSTTVKFELYRSWEPENIIDTKTYTVVVTAQ